MTRAGEIAAVSSTRILIHLETDGVEACGLKAKSEAAASCEKIKSKRTQRVLVVASGAGLEQRSVVEFVRVFAHWSPLTLPACDSWTKADSNYRRRIQGALRYPV